MKVPQTVKGLVVLTFEKDFNVTFWSAIAVPGGT